MLEAGADEHRAARDAFLLTAPPLAAVRVTGPDRKAFLHGLLTADVKGLGAGDATRAFLLTPKGKAVSELWLYDRGDDLLALARPAALAGLLRGLGKSIVLSETKLEDATASSFALLLLGPRAGEAASALEASGAPGAAKAAWKGRELWRLPCGFWGAGGVLLFGAGSPPSGLVDELLALAPGARRGAVEAAEALRVEAGVPAFGHEIDEETYPLELGSDEGISYEKGCYLGQETTSKMKHLGRPNRTLARLKLHGPVEPGVDVLLGEETVGRLTSAARTPSGFWGLSVVKNAAARPESRLSAGPAAALVCPG